MNNQNNYFHSWTISIRITIVIALVLLLLIPTWIHYNKVLLAVQQNCTADWYVTGYSTPVESDYNGSKLLVKVISHSSVVQGREFYKSFLHDVKVEGWGRTLEGDYVGLDTNDKQWHSSPYPVGSTDGPLRPHNIAVDPNLIRIGQKLVISTLPAPWNKITLIAEDVGPDIKGKHIDVYTGEGKNAGEETFRITGHNNEVCTL